MHIFWASGNTTACFPAMSCSSSSQVVLAMSYPTFGPCLKTSISVSLVIVVGADEEQLRGTGGGVEVTMTIWIHANIVAKNTLSEGRLQVLIKGTSWRKTKNICTKSSSHLATRLIKVSPNCSAKPSSLLLGPQGGLPYAVSSKFSPFFQNCKMTRLAFAKGSSACQSCT